ncbi:hypothetical protein CAL14_13315 [Bordetella genomosp. 9]|nr:hypothetical protein CAL14_13315 [Bordetella genomosp. 9]
MAASLLMLAGCAAGIEPGGDYPSVTFDVSAPYDAAYRRASEFVRVCHTEREYRYGLRYGDNHSVDEKFATTRIEVFKLPEPTRHLEIIETKPNTKVTSTVTVTVVGAAPWDAQELAAARQSIQTATPVCRPGAD